jgi:hypothetical protein
MKLTADQRSLLAVLNTWDAWGGYFADDYRTWKRIKRLQGRRLVKRADRRSRWSNQFWLLTEAGCRALSATERDHG